MLDNLAQRVNRRTKKKNKKKEGTPRDLLKNLFAGSVEICVTGIHLLLKRERGGGGCVPPPEKKYRLKVGLQKFFFFSVEGGPPPISNADEKHGHVRTIPNKKQKETNKR